MTGYALNYAPTTPKYNVTGLVQTNLVYLSPYYAVTAYNSTPATQANVNAVAYLIGTYSNTGTNNTLVNRLTASEVNVAIWDIFTNSGATVYTTSSTTAANSNNDFEISSTSSGASVTDFVSQVNSYVSEAYANTSPTEQISWVANSQFNSSYKDFGVVTKYDIFVNTNTTPEPGSITMLIGFGISAGIFMAKNRRKRA